MYATSAMFTMCTLQQSYTERMTKRRVVFYIDGDIALWPTDRLSLVLISTSTMIPLYHDSFVFTWTFITFFFFLSLFSHLSFILFFIGIFSWNFFFEHSTQKLCSLDSQNSQYSFTVRQFCGINENSSSSLHRVQRRMFGRSGENWQVNT